MCKSVSVGLRADYDPRGDIMRLGLDGFVLPQSSEDAKLLWDEQAHIDEKFGLIWFSRKKFPHKEPYYTRATIFDWSFVNKERFMTYITSQTGWKKDILEILSAKAFQKAGGPNPEWGYCDERLLGKEAVIEENITPFVKTSTYFSKRRKRSILNWFWQPNTFTPGPTIAHIEQTVQDADQIMLPDFEGKSNKPYKNFFLKKAKDFSAPEPSKPYIVVVKYAPDKKKKWVLTAFMMGEETIEGLLWHKRETKSKK